MRRRTARGLVIWHTRAAGDAAAALGVRHLAELEACKVYAALVASLAAAAEIGGIGAGAADLGARLHAVATSCLDYIAR